MNYSEMTYYQLSELMNYGTKNQHSEALSALLDEMYDNGRKSYAELREDLAQVSDERGDLQDERNSLQDDVDFMRGEVKSAETAVIALRSALYAALNDSEKWAREAALVLEDTARWAE